MVTIRNEEKGAVLIFNEDGEKRYVYVTDLMAKMWNDYIREIIDSVYACGLLEELGFTDTEVSRMLKQLETGRKEFVENDYMEVSYR